MRKFESRSADFPGERWRSVIKVSASRVDLPPSGAFTIAALQPVFLVATLLLLIGLAAPAHAQISPGPLARAHHSLDGPSNCTECHTQSVRERAFRCTECHREIATELSQHRGLHSTFANGGEPGSGCVKCHSDHNGEDFNMVHWDPTPKGFDHTKTGYALDGKHVGVTCRACHTPQHIPAAARGIFQGKDISHTYMGLSRQCGTCHEDKHQGRFGSNCSQCHNTNEWKSANIDSHGFDHSKTRFPLTGAHRDVACEKCHTAGPDGQPRYAGIGFASCATCHADVHKHEFKQGCDYCHTTSTWKKSSFGRVFDHSTTGYPLLGKHAEVACLDCHKGTDFKQPVAHAQCADCHTPDPHNGEFSNRPGGNKCETCHTVDGWHPSKFTVSDHASTKYPLGPAHEHVACVECHTSSDPKTQFHIAFGKCLDCHKDEHNGQFAAAPWLNKCEQCHTGATWKNTTFTLAKHQKGSFPLTGSHMAVACNDCHKPMAGSPGALFHFSNVSCATCHEDIHHGEFASRMAALSPAHKPAGCESCHTTKDWHDMHAFDHSTTKFALEGSHRAVPCAECHKPPNLERTMLHVNFGQAPSECRECHENPHADQFGNRAEQCAGCHNTNKWKPSLFDHETTAFSLKGGHQDVACSACHLLKKPVNGQQVLFYKPTPKACADCHSNGIPKASAGLDFPAFRATRIPSA